MSSRMNFSGSFERFLKGDVDPGNIFGFNPSRAELRANKADRSRRASQIAAEQNSEALRAAGGSIDPATKQVRKLSAGEKTHLKALSPFNPVPLPSVTVTAAITESGKNKKERKKAKQALAAKNKKHADTALLAKNLNESETTRFSNNRLRRSILGGTR